MPLDIPMRIGIMLITCIGGLNPHFMMYPGTGGGASPDGR
jgi:hypothetical protein